MLQKNRSKITEFHANVFQFAQSMDQHESANAVADDHRGDGGGDDDVGPRLMTKYEFVEQLNVCDFAASHFSNSVEEERLLEYVESFRRQFVQLFPARQHSLFLAPLNEFGVRKFVVSSVRPTLQKFVTLWDYRRCIEFVASFLEYVPLRQQTECPDLLISNDVLLRIRCGDCLDYSNLLCSLLRGSGYNAFIVHGVAKYAVTQNDQSGNEIDPEILDSTKWPDDGEPEPDDLAVDGDGGGVGVGGDGDGGGVALDDDDGIPDHYRPPRSGSVGDGGSGPTVRRYSEYVAEREAASRRLRERELSTLNGMARAELFDPLERRRVHFWILLRGGLREIEGEDLMVEPVSGKIYGLNHPDSPFVAVESVWNDSNYWVNVQAQSGSEETVGIESMSFDLGDAAKWEFVVVDDAATAQSANGGAQSVGGNEEEAVGAEKERVHLPGSWMAPFFVSSKQIECPFPRHSVTVHFSKWSLTKCNRFHSKRGLVLKLTLFRDDSKLIIDEIRELFSDRKDLLILRITKLQRARSNVIYERFAIGRSSGIKELITIGQQRRITTFYGDSRSDGMVKRTEVFALSVTERFKDRGDGVVRRTMLLEPERPSMATPIGSSGDAVGSPSVEEAARGAVAGGGGADGNGHGDAVRFRLCLGGDPNLECSVQRIEEEYGGQHGAGRGGVGKMGGNGKGDGVRLLTLDILKSEYAVNYHYGANRILSKKCSFNKESGSVIGWNPNPLSTNPDAVALKQQFEELIVAEKNLLTEIRERERAFGVLLSKIEDEREPNNLSLSDHVYFGAKSRSTAARRAGVDHDLSIDDEHKMDHHQTDRADAEQHHDRYSMLHSFLPKSLKDGNLKQRLSREQMEQIKEDALRSLKERLVQRLNVITKRLHSEIQSLEKEKANFENWQNRDSDAMTEHDGTVDGVGAGVAPSTTTTTTDRGGRELMDQQKESVFRAKQKESEFRINIIKQRLAKHEQAAIHKMNELSDLLDSYPPLQ